MNSTPQDTQGESFESAPQPSQTDHAQRKALARQLRAERILRWLSRSPFFQPFCHLFGPAVHWLMEPTNSVIALLILILSPFIGLLVLPIFLVLIPACLGIAVIAIIANSMKMDGEEGESPHFISHSQP